MSNYSEIHPLLASSFFMLSSTKTANYQKAANEYIELLKKLKSEQSKTSENSKDLKDIYFDQIEIYTYLNKPDELDKAIINFCNVAEYPEAHAMLQGAQVVRIMSKYAKASETSKASKLSESSETSDKSGDVDTPKLSESSNTSDKSDKSGDVDTPETPEVTLGINIIRYFAEALDIDLYKYKLAQLTTSEESIKLLTQLYEKYIATDITANLKASINKRSQSITLKDSYLPSAYAEADECPDIVEAYLRNL